MVRTDVDALAAVDAQLPENVRLAIMDADCSSGQRLTQLVQPTQSPLSSFTE